MTPAEKAARQARIDAVPRQRLRPVLGRKPPSQDELDLRWAEEGIWREQRERRRRQ